MFLGCIRPRFRARFAACCWLVGQQCAGVTSARCTPLALCSRGAQRSGRRRRVRGKQHATCAQPSSLRGMHPVFCTCQCVGLGCATTTGQMAIVRRVDRLPFPMWCRRPHREHAHARIGQPDIALPDLQRVHPSAVPMQMRAVGVGKHAWIAHGRRRTGSVGTGARGTHREGGSGSSDDHHGDPWSSRCAMRDVSLPPTHLRYRQRRLRMSWVPDG